MPFKISVIKHTVFLKFFREVIMIHWKLVVVLLCPLSLLVQYIHHLINLLLSVIIFVFMLMIFVLVQTVFLVAKVLCSLGTSFKKKNSYSLLVTDFFEHLFIYIYFLQCKTEYSVTSISAVEASLDQ